MVRPARFDVTVDAGERATTVSVVGELDMKTAVVLAQRLDQLPLATVTSLTVDLRELAFMDSSGLRLLIELHDRSRQEGWRLALIAPEHEPAAIVLRATGADLALPFEPA
ncbi:MAG: STAS domain-containing protein [Solirubrobacteraceae bacterium]